MSNQANTIWHVDLDSFFVSAERLRDPKLIGKVMAVGGRGGRSVISSASYEARKFGITSAMPVAQALKKYPALILVPGHYDLYQKLSAQVFAILAEYSPRVEATGIDEGYLDMTGSRTLFGEPAQAAERLRAQVRAQTGLAISIGIASNRMMAKIATDQGKPDGFKIVEAGEEAAFLAPLSVKVIPGVGRVTFAWLQERGILTIAQLRELPLEMLERHLGSLGSYLYGASRGEGGTAFFEVAKKPAISRERTFEKDVGDLKKLESVLWELASELGKALRADEDENKRFARELKLKLRYPPFETLSRSRVLDRPMQLDKDLYDAAHALFVKNWDRSRPLRLIGVGFSMGGGVEQLGLFDNLAERERQTRVQELKDKLCNRFGEGALKTGRDLAD